MGRPTAGVSPNFCTTRTTSLLGFPAPASLFTTLALVLLSLLALLYVSTAHSIAGLCYL